MYFIGYNEGNVPFKEVVKLLKLDTSKKKKIFCVLLPATFIIGGLVWYLSPGKADVREREVTKIDQTILTAQDTKILQMVFYEKCQEEEKRELRLKENEMSLNYAEFQALYPGWNIEMFNSGQVKMSLLDKGFCTEHRKHKFIGIQGDYVAIFYGMMLDKPVLKELTQIKATSLHPQALEEVKKGIEFQSNEEMLRILEGLHSK